MSREAPRPFQQLPFAALPTTPRVPHRFFELPAERVDVPSAHFGRVRIALRRGPAVQTSTPRPPLVLVHGLMTSSYSFRYALEAFARSFDVLAFDLPGAGESEAVDVAHGPRELADLIGELVRTLGLEGTAMIGNSMGGYLAMWLALRRPTAIGRLVNLHSPGLVTPRMQALSVAGRLPGSRRMLDALVRHDPERWVHRNVHYFDETLKSREESRTYAAPLRTATGRAAFARQLFDTMAVEGLRDFERTLRATRFPIPLRLVYARQDPMVPPAIGERLRALVPGAEFVWLERGSHFAHVDALEAFVEASESFLLGS